VKPNDADAAPIKVPVSQFRADFADLLNRVIYRGERILITRYAVVVAQLSPPCKEVPSPD